MDPHKQQMRHSSQDCDWRTPPAMVAALSATAGGFDLDLAATAHSAVVRIGEGPTEQVVYLGPDHPNPALHNALFVPWHDHGRRGFLNPPYSLTQYSLGLKAGEPRETLQWLLIESWARKAYQESLRGFTTWGVFPYAPQTEWFREYVMGHGVTVSKANKDLRVGWTGHAALDFWRISHRVSFLQPDGSPAANANVNTAIIIWGPNPGWQGPWVPSGRYWTWRT